MYPSCSRYGLDAIKKNGAIKGWIMTCDRLMRCGGDETKRSDLVRTGQCIRHLDPVENNDFWWE